MRVRIVLLLFLALALTGSVSRILVGELLGLAVPHDGVMDLCLKDEEEAVFADGLEGLWSPQDGAVRCLGRAELAGCHGGLVWTTSRLKASSVERLAS